MTHDSKLLINHLSQKLFRKKTSDVPKLVFTYQGSKQGGGEEVMTSQGSKQSGGEEVVTSDTEGEMESCGGLCVEQDTLSIISRRSNLDVRNLMDKMETVRRL